MVNNVQTSLKTKNKMAAASFRLHEQIRELSVFPDFKPSSKSQISKPQPSHLGKLKKIPILAELPELLEQLSETGESADQLSHLHHKVEVPAFQGMSLASSAISFIKIPATLLSAWILGKKPAVTWSKSAEWIFTTAIFALAILSLAAPVTAPAIGYFGAAYALVTSVYTLGKHFYDRRRTLKQIQNQSEKIHEGEIELRNIMNDANDQRLILEDSTKKEEHPKAEREIQKLHELYLAKKNEIQDLYNDRDHNQQLMKHLSWKGVLGKGFSVALASAGLAGLILSAFIPPVGLSILTACGAVGIFSLVAPSLLSVGKFINRHFASKASMANGQIDTPQEDLTQQQDVENTHQDEMQSSLSSDALVIGELNTHPTSPSEPVDVRVESDVNLEVDEKKPSQEEEPLSPAQLEEKVPTEEESDTSGESEGSPLSLK